MSFPIDLLLLLVAACIVGLVRNGDVHRLCKNDLEEEYLLMKEIGHTGQNPRPMFRRSDYYCAHYNRIVLSVWIPPAKLRKPLHEFYPEIPEAEIRRMLGDQV